MDYADAAAMALTLLGETSGLVMEGALDPEPEHDDMPLMPEMYQQIGNYVLRRNDTRLARGRYG